MNNMIPYEELLPYILPSVGDVPEVIAAHAAREATIELATKSSEIKLTLTLDAQAGVPYYRIAAPDAYGIQSLIYVEVDGAEYRPNLDSYGFGRPYSYTYDQTEERIILNPPPRCSRAGGIEVRYTGVPSQDSCFLPRSIYTRHAELIANGALMRLYRMKDADWFDMALAREYERTWTDGMRWARVATAKGGSTAPLRMRARRAV